MTPKERAAMQQALEALEELHYSSGTVVAARKYELATAALRESLDHSGEANEMVEFFSKEMKNKISVARAEQAEQEPVAWMNDSTPMGVFARHKEGAQNFGCTIPLYAAPVRTKDLTDDEIAKAIAPFQHEFIATGRTTMNFARAVIQADREKNNANNNT